MSQRRQWTAARSTGMSKEMIISSSAHETRVAILEDDQVAEIFIERERSRGVVGNVYKGRVSKVLPGMQSAFVDLGLERDGFLYVTDVVAAFEELDRFETEEDEQLRRLAATAAWRAAGGGDGGPDESAIEPRRRSSLSNSGSHRTIARRPRSGKGSRAEDRRAPQRRSGDHRPGGQGAAWHQGRPPDLARHDAGALPGLHADGRPCRRIAKNRVARGALTPAGYRPRVPRADRLRAAG